MKEIRDLLFYVENIQVLHQLIRVKKACRYIQSPSEYLLWVQSDEQCTPIREELSWWTKTLNGEVLHLPVRK